MRADKKKHMYELPVEVFKTEIRRQHRQQIRKEIINKFLELEAFNQCLTKLCTNVHKHIHTLINNNENHHTGISTISIDFRKHEQRKHLHSQYPHQLEMRQIDKLVTQLNYYLNQIDSYQLQQIFIVEQENKAKNQTNATTQNCCEFGNKLIKTKLIQLIQLYIPQIVEILAKKESISHYIDNSQFHHQSPHSEQIIDDFLLKGVTNLHQINCQKLVKQSISILCILSSMSTLTNAYSQSCQEPTIQTFSKVLNYQPIRLISYQLMQMINPTNIFYQSLIAMGNILHHTIINSSLSQQQPTNNYLYYCQVLNDIQIQQILVCLFIPYNENYQLILQHTTSTQKKKNPHQNQQWLHRYQDENNSNGDDRQQLILWFTSIYVKYLYCHQRRTINNELLIRELEMYVVNAFNYIISSTTHNVLKSNEQYIYEQNGDNQNNNYNDKYVKLTQKHCKQIRKLTTIIDYSNLTLDNLTIINTILPLLKHNWHLPQVAKLWKYLTFKGEYNLPQLINMHDLQVHMLTAKDKSTIKHIRHCQEQEENYESQSQEDEQQSTQTIHNNNKQANPNETSSISSLISQIFQTLTNEPHKKPQIKVDLDLLDGVYNLLLEMDHTQAHTIWQLVYQRNERLQNKMAELHHLIGLFQKIQEYIGLQPNQSW